ncbi:hypothetical protein EGW08_021632 [Elysia chlorotica]|uniref:Reverse transcriptase domain-containing protein n=1 Tax=Elysia chlorotica TaxID=188477 RepID=A0A3S1BMN0_ELYCH|nr:hypothetical protein EGW08_021632 [Elysia chlorotica]
MGTELPIVEQKLHPRSPHQELLQERENKFSEDMCRQYNRRHLTNKPQAEINPGDNVFIKDLRRNAAVHMSATSSQIWRNKQKLPIGFGRRVKQESNRLVTSDQPTLISVESISKQRYQTPRRLGSSTTATHSPECYYQVRPSGRMRLSSPLLVSGSFLRMPSGLKNAAQSSQRLMDGILRGVPFAFIYLDDILVASHSAQEHFQHLRQLFILISSNGLIINKAKCVFGADKLDFLGHRVSAEGTTPLPDRIAALQDSAPPRDRTSLQRVLEFTKKIRYIKGKFNVVALADALSRINTVNISESTVETTNLHAIVTDSHKDVTIDFSRMASYQETSDEMASYHTSTTDRS